MTCKRANVIHFVQKCSTSWVGNGNGRNAENAVRGRISSPVSGSLRAIIVWGPVARTNDVHTRVGGVLLKITHSRSAIKPFVLRG